MKFLLREKLSKRIRYICGGKKNNFTKKKKKFFFPQPFLHLSKTSYWVLQPARENFIELIGRCCSENPENRPYFDSILEDLDKMWEKLNLAEKEEILQLQLASQTTGEYTESN